MVGQEYRNNKTKEVVKIEYENCFEQILGPCIVVKGLKEGCIAQIITIEEFHTEYSKISDTEFWW